MARVKSPYKKIILGKARKEARPVPAWVMVKTKRHVRSSPKQRSWRRRRIKP